LKIDTAGSRRISLGRGYMAYRLVLLVVLPSILICTLVWLEVHLLAIRYAMCAAVAVIASLICLRAGDVPEEFVEVTSHELCIVLTDYELRIPLAEIVSIRETNVAGKYTYDGNDLCDPFEIHLRNGDVHHPTLRPGLYKIVRETVADVLRASVSYQ
jgi:hypothetical protein